MNVSDTHFKSYPLEFKERKTNKLYFNSKIIRGVRERKKKKIYLCVCLNFLKGRERNEESSEKLNSNCFLSNSYFIENIAIGEVGQRLTSLQTLRVSCNQSKVQ